MISHHVPDLSQQRVVLASASPRRSEILSKNLGMKNFRIIPSSFDEKLPHARFSCGAQYALETALHKAQDVQAVCNSNRNCHVDLIIAADTVVEHERKILEKPSDRDDAYQMLSRLSGDWHKVHTGVALILPNAEPSGKPFTHTFSCTTEVEFDELSDEWIWSYIDSGEPFDKCGGYGIQGAAGAFVKKINGCYFNVVGFPVNAFTKQMKRLVQDGYLPSERLLVNAHA